MTTIHLVDYRRLPRLLWAYLTGCPCRFTPYLDHHGRRHHVRNGR